MNEEKKEILEDVKSKLKRAGITDVTDEDLAGVLGLRDDYMEIDPAEELDKWKKNPVSPEKSWNSA